MVRYRLYRMCGWSVVSAAWLGLAKGVRLRRYALRALAFLVGCWLAG